MNKVHVIGCGGCGINVTIALAKELNAMSNIGAYSSLEYSFLDTSEANKEVVVDNGFTLSKTVSAKRTKADTIGSGGVRGANLEEINALIDKTVDTFDNVKNYNGLFIIISSTSGGSGSVIAPQLTSALLEKGLTTLVIAIGDDRSMQYTTNSIRTLKTYIAKSKTLKKPISLLYLSNAGNKEEDNNNIITTVVRTFSLLWSGNNRDLDLSDIKSFLDITKLTNDGIPRQGLNIIDITPDLSSLDTKGLLASRVLSSDNIPVKYLGTVSDIAGYITDESILEDYADLLPLYITLTTGVTVGVIEKLSITESEYAEHAANLGIDEIEDVGEDLIV